MSAPLLIGEQPVDVVKPDEADERYWSVTTIIGCLDKPPLMWWCAETVALAAVHSRDTWMAMERENGTKEAIDWLKRARFRPPKDEMPDNDFGTAVHELVEHWTVTGQRPEPNPEFFGAKDLELAKQCLDRFGEWLDKFQPTYQAAEVTVYNRTYGYAGTCDCFLTIDGVPLIGDYKVSKKSWTKKKEPNPIYPEAALQLVGYKNAELAAVWRARRFESFKRRYYLLSKSEIDQSVAVPQVEAGVGIKITPEHCLAYPLRVDDAVWDAFLYVLEAARWQFDISKSVVGDPLQPPARSEAA